jgi:putative peptide zinc metalloprotease protein
VTLASADGRASEPVSTIDPSALPSADVGDVSDDAHRPSRTTGIELLGALTGSGYRNPPSLVRRLDGQTVQLTPLLYLVLEAVDGRRTYAELAEVVSTAYGRRLAPDDVRQLVETRLRPLGLVRGTDGSEPQVQKANPLLALRFRWVVSDPTVTRRLTAPFAALFTPVVMVVALVAFAVVSAWVLFTKGLASATHQAFDQPLLLVLVFAITIFSAGFHEFGHASACRYGGATPGAMGTGLYLVWPAFYTDVTDSYRLGRAGRLRVDLGGLYFNALVAVAMFAVWEVTRWDALLLILAAQLLQMVRQLAPMVRFDGYHVLADLTGVPDLSSRIGPTLRSLVPGRAPEPRATELKRWARVVVTTWVLVIVPLLLVTLVLMVLALPRVLGTAWVSVVKQAHALGVDWAGGDLTGVAVRALAVVAVCLPVLGSLVVLARLVRTVLVSLWRRTAGRPGRRALAGLLVVAVAAALAWAWWPDADRYRPVQPFEKGTVVDGLAAVSFPGRAAGLSDGRIVEGQRTVWASTSTPPTRDHPELALVLVPKASAGGADSTAPTWVFPFNRPGAPGAGDNQALAVNTTDGSTLYDVAFALVWADGNAVTNSNEAYAFASCTGCKTVAVAFQVVLITGDAHVAIPQNISGAVNYSCAQCVTYALAQQLVLTVPADLDPAARQRLDALWRQIAAFSTTIGTLSLDEVRSRLLGYEDQIKTLVAAAAATAAPGATPTPSTSLPTTPAATATTAVSGSTATSSGTSSLSSGSPQPTATTPLPSESTAPATPTDGLTGGASAAPSSSPVPTTTAP